MRARMRQRKPVVCAESEPLGVDAWPAWAASLRSCRRSAFSGYNENEAWAYDGRDGRSTMSGKQHRRSVSDRARRRAVRALAARLGVAYSVAARLLTAHQVGVA